LERVSKQERRNGKRGRESPPPSPLYSEKGNQGKKGKLRRLDSRKWPPAGLLHEGEDKEGKRKRYPLNKVKGRKGEGEKVRDV